MSHDLHVVHRVRHGRAAGFTLVEALVALVVLSIGMLGIAALYMETLRASRSALYRTEAVTMAADLADRIRANRNPADAYTGAGLNAIALADLADWNAVVATLPDGAGEIRFVNGLGAIPSTYIIRVSWTEVGQVDPVVYELRIEV
jgi:type IV pilus assembly protein PilV